MQVLHEASLNSETVLESWFLWCGRGSEDRHHPGVNDMECHRRDCWMLLAVQDVWFCISVTADGAGWFPCTDCTVFPQYSLQSQPEPGCLCCAASATLPGSLWCRFSSSANFPGKYHPSRSQERKQLSSTCSHRSESPLWFWGLPVSYFCRVSHSSFFILHHAALKFSNVTNFIMPKNIWHIRFVGNKQIKSPESPKLSLLQEHRCPSVLVHQNQLCAHGKLPQQTAQAL